MVEYKDSLRFLQGSRFLPFLLKFDVYDLAVMLKFARTFDGSTTRVGSSEFEVTEHSIAQATGLATTREKWFKKEKLEEGA